MAAIYNRWIVAIAALAAAVFLPLGGLALALLQAPPPYLLVAEPGPEWRDGQATAAEGRVMVRAMADQGAASKAARQLLESIPTSLSRSSPGVHRYRASESGERGLILALDSYVVQVAALDEAALDKAVASLPFMAANSERAGIALAFDENPGAFVIGILAYALALIVLSSRLLAWAARRYADPNRPGAAEAELRRRLLALELPGFEILERANGEIVFEQTYHSASEQTRLRLDPVNRVVRAVVVGSARKTRWGLSGLVMRSWWRTMPLGPRKGRIAQAVLESGWTWQPVFSFIKLIGG